MPGSLLAGEKGQHTSLWAQGVGCWSCGQDRPVWCSLAAREVLQAALRLSRQTRDGPDFVSPIRLEMEGGVSLLTGA